MKILLSVAIPTKDRYDVLIPTLEAMLLRIRDPDVEFVVSDNSRDSSKLLSFIESAGESRLRVAMSTDPMSMSGNVDRALNMASGEYVVVMGDDDFLHPLALPLLRRCLATSPDCVVYPRGTYYWPDVEFQSECEFFESASMQIVASPDLGEERLCSKATLEAVMDQGAVYLLDLPGAYHAVVRKSALDAYRTRIGTFVGGPSPDMAIAVALACTLRSHVKINFPVSIAGASYNSAAGMGRRGAHSASLDDLPAWLPATMRETWSPDLPRVWNGFTVYAQTVKEVCKKFGVPVRLNFEALLTKIIDQDRRDLGYVLSSVAFRSLPLLRRWKVLVRGLAFSYRRSAFHYLPTAIRSRIIRRQPFFSRLKHFRGLQSVGQCMDLLSEIHESTVQSYVATGAKVVTSQSEHRVHTPV